MSCVYVTEQGSEISIGEGMIVIDCKNGIHREIPHRGRRSRYSRQDHRCHDWCEGSPEARPWQRCGKRGLPTYLEMHKI